jgi:hypothetical protein
MGQSELVQVIYRGGSQEVTADRILICKSRFVFRPLAPFINPSTLAQKGNAQFQVATPAPRFQGVLKPEKPKSALIELFATSEPGFLCG